MTAAKEALSGERKKSNTATGQNSTAQHHAPRRTNPTILIKSEAPSI
jgi:hypothetical protein